MDFIDWCMDFSLILHDKWMARLSKAATYLVEAISTETLTNIHTIQAGIRLLPLFANVSPDPIICLQLHQK
jgi:hypothetical protein